MAFSNPSPTPPALQDQSRNPFEESMAPGRKRVGFTPEVGSSSRSTEDSQESGPGDQSPLPLRSDVSHEELSEEIHRAFGQPYVPKPRPAIRNTSRTPLQFKLDVEDVDENDEKKRSGIEAQARATRLSRSVGTFSASAPGSRRNSDERLISIFPAEDVPLRSMGHNIPVESAVEEDELEKSEPRSEFLDQADKLLRQHTIRAAPSFRPEDLYHSRAVTPLQSGQITPVNEVEIEAEHVPRPAKYRTGVLGTLFKAQAAGHGPSSRNSKVYGHAKHSSGGSFTFSGASTAANSPTSSPPSSGAVTPSHPRRHWYTRSANASTTSISKLVESSHMLATPGQKEFGQEMGEKHKKARPGMGPRNISKDSITSALSKLTKSKAGQYKIQLHIAGILARQKYLRQLCKALMMYGAPTHRLEEYMSMSARVLEIEAQFLYIPGCMIISFDDSSVHTTEVKLVRTVQGVDLGKLRDVHEIYKDVVHDRIGVEEATPRLEAIMSRKIKFNNWLRVFVYGLASATVGPFAFEARPIDLPFCFLLGCLIGWLQLIVAPKNELITNVFEIGAAVLTSFISRGLGSIKHNGKEIFCFSAMAQSSIALILPGFMVLCASLELQSRHIVAGSVRMVYAIIYSLFLGYGITIGTVIFGLMYKDATSETSCKNPMSSHYYYFFEIAFSLCLMIINQAKYKQIPAMTVIALAGYVVNFHSSQYFKGNAQVSNTLGALTIGIAANVHARFSRHIDNWGLDLWENTLRPRFMRLKKRWLRHRHGPRGDLHLWPSSGGPRPRPASVASEPYVPKERKIGYGLAAAAMLPAIFVQVPSGLSVNGSLVSGVTSADQIVRNTTNYTTITATEAASSSGMNSVALTVGFSVIQVAIGITVGLFLAALFVYPLGKGKRRSGLFSF